MSKCNEELSESIERAKCIYNEYFQSQKDFEIPEAKISIEKDSNERTKVYMDVEYLGTEFQFESIEEKDINNIYEYLNNQPLVRLKYGNGNLISLQDTIKRINTFIQRFQNSNSPLYLYSGFTVNDNQTETFLGMANLGSSTQIQTSEIAFLNRMESWKNSNFIGFKNYSGVGTIEACTLIQYASHLKKENYLINGQILQSVIATSRIDNQGSWKSCAKAKMILDQIDYIYPYQNNLRYQLKFSI